LQRLLAGSLGVSFFLVPLYPAFISLTGAPVPGISLLPRPLTIALLVLVALIAAYWTALLLTSPRRPMPTLLPVAAFPAAALVAALLGFDPLAGALFIAILAGGVIWHAAILRFAREPGVVTTIFASYLLSGALASLAAIVMVLTKTPAALYTIGHGRAIGTFVLPGELAGYLILYVPVAYATARVLPRLRPLALTGLVVSAVAFVLTFSRAGFIGMAAAIAAYVLMRRRRSGARYAVAVMSAALIVVAFAFNAHHDPSENFTRLSIWNAALRLAGDLPLSGAGPFQFAQLYPLVRLPDGEPTAFHAHSILLTVAAETGIVGVAALLFGWWRFATTLRARLRDDAPLKVLAVAIAAGLIGTWVQGLIDTISVVIFGLWLPFMALATACAEGLATDAEPDTVRMALRQPSGAKNAVMRRLSGATTVGAFAAAVILAMCAFVQIASASIFAGAVVPIGGPPFVPKPYSLAAHLPRRVGVPMYELVERIAPFPFAEELLAEDALSNGEHERAAEHVTHLPPGTIRSALEARIALFRPDRDEAIRLFLQAGDDAALQSIVATLALQGRTEEAYELEQRLRDKLATTATRPDALANSWWVSARLAARLGDDSEAARDYGHASALAPLNTKYLLDAGKLALKQHDPATAAQLFARVRDLDPADADAVAGQGFAALQRGDTREAALLSRRADEINGHATLAVALRTALRQSRGTARPSTVGG
jgi:O-antigen ligase